MAAAKESFLAGDQYAYIAGIIAVLLGAALVFFMMFPKRDEEQRLLVEYHTQDTAGMPAPVPGHGAAKSAQAARK